MKHIEIRFVPNYLKRAILNDITLSQYDHNDLFTFDKLINDLLLATPSTGLDDTATATKLLNLYYKPELVYNFTEDKIITDANTPAFEIFIDKDSPIGLEGYTLINVVCGEGSTNLRDFYKPASSRRSVLKWLFDYLVKNGLDEQALFNTALFEGYWLN